MNEIREKIENILNKNDLGLYTMMKYHFGLDSEQIPYDYPLGEITKRISNFLKVDDNLSLNIAASVELLNASFNVHEDVRNGNTERFSRESLWWKYGPAQAINVGDGFQALSRIHLLELGKKSGDYNKFLSLLTNFDNAIIEICEAENRELTLQESPITSEKDYFSVLVSKYGALLSCSIVSSGVLSNYIDEDLNKLRDISNSIILSEKISQEISLLDQQEIVDSPKLGSLLSKNKPLSVIYCFERGDATHKRMLGEIYLDRIIDPKKIESIKSICKELDTFNLAQEKSNEFRDQSVEMMHSLKFSDELINFIYEKIKSI